ncbi:GNAT family N-acetyltransferase [Halomonas sp. MCCC 1A17488]|uniref:GNAT family N-acetyltransferase n=1 Tax=Billgrantia sulfidoxydans TaxID=2733484 RepID=A0ABX7W856_9GAMM|nr:MULTISPECIES: GNAT family N-acetyltransferase [Halomonas]MCE8015058.1 GNAT family N-acetyltransferase [Halomonas sp. MCCC 1A17488]MCG3238391.1 GNAT family N-acetyltransferase [Halomonas sp. MCCC 1A17488]QPP47866.1 GNAT family N-acetyltransferase [Halomonas sp. SS10-MC5]QTP55169.1 GNAT family N-acetyltransferase [Halomonas sulfidoxydans]
MNANAASRHLRVAFEAAALIARNLRRTRGFATVPLRHHDGYRLCAMRRPHLPGALALYAELHDGQPLDLPRRWLYRLAGNRLGVVALDINGRVVGAAFYGFSRRDLREDRVHSSFSGVHPAHRGRGLATELRRTAILHFRANGVRGYSSRISADNVASLKPSLRLGFHIAERYQDPVSGEQRYYLVCDFDDDYRDDTTQGREPQPPTPETERKAVP